MMELRNTPASSLDKFTKHHLLSNTEFHKQVKSAIKIICTFLKERCFRFPPRPVRVSKVVKGGSSREGTTLRGRSDADLVVFLTNLKSFREHFECRGEFIKEIRRQLEACQREERFEVQFEVQKQQNPRALSFVLRSPNQAVEFDVLPAFDALGQLTKGYRPDPQIYVQLIQECEKLGGEGEFSPCFTELQTAFLKERLPMLKSLICLVKHWYQLCKMKYEHKLPPQYALELLTIYAWEQGSSKPQFSTAQGFRTVLALILKHQDLCIYWKKYYDLENPTISQYLRRQLAKPRPVILDPVDPTGNVAGGDPQTWQLLAQEVTVWLKYSCCENLNGRPVRTWKVPELKPAASGSSSAAYGSPVPSDMMELRNTLAKSLDKFIEDHLLSNAEFRRQVRQAIDTICTFLKERCFPCAPRPVRVSKVVKGGSSGKGTTLRGRSDADLVVFLTNLTSFREQLQRRGQFIEEIRIQLEACQREERFEVEFEVQKQQNPRALSFVLRSPKLNQAVEFDVLPAFDALGQLTKDYRPDPEIYVQVIQECEKLRREGEFSPCFTELQRAFLKERPAKLKSLIRLVKHWYQLCKMKYEHKLPPQYALELLTIYAWEQGSSKPEFSTAQGFRTVLALILKHQDLCIYWKKYYDLENPTISQYLRRQLAKPRPVILDPADPTGNVAGGDPQRWQLLAQEVTIWLKYSCCKNMDGTPVSTWNVPWWHQSAFSARVVQALHMLTNTSVL
ncbi:2'-5'-oligoadenylate synthase 3-like isoform X1 [Ovis canadensis]|uniref:2'-5'-oligoadenylate synthase 3-like isoform X1 n=2 Tax=Ovis canadensis TaxID=37174 RepID=UPI0037511C86